MKTRFQRHTLIAISLGILLAGGGFGDCATPEDLHLKLLTQWGLGSTGALTMYNEFLVYGRGAAIEVAVIDETNTPSVVGRVETSHAITDLAIKDHLLFAAAWRGGLLVFDLSDPTAPVEIGSHPSTGATRAVAVHDDLVVTAESNGGLSAFAVDDPTAPVEVYSCDEMWLRDVVADDEYAYGIDDRARLWIFGRSGYYRLRQLWTVELEENGRHIALGGDLLYYTQSDSDPYANALNVLDISVPSDPIEIGRIWLNNEVFGLTVNGSMAYTSESGVGTRPTGFRMIDVSDPSDPKPVGFYQDRRVSRVLVSGAYAFVGTSLGTLRIVDVADPNNPIVVSETPIGGNIVDVSVVGNLMYVLDDETGLWVVDIKRSPPRQVGYARVTIGTELEAAGNLVYASTRHGIKVFDVSDPTSPVEVFSLICGGTADCAEVEVDGSYAYGVERGYFGGLRVFDVSDPLSAVQVAHLRDLRGPHNLSVEDNIAYFLVDTGLLIMDVSNPAIPEELSFFPVTHTSGLEVADGIAYISRYGDNRVGALVDVRNPRMPVELFVFMWGEILQDEAISGDALYVLDQRNDIRVIDISRPSSPREVQFIETDQYIKSIRAFNDRLYVSQSGAIRIYQRPRLSDKPFERDDVTSSSD